jgi:hypothetical protein
MPSKVTARIVIFIFNCIAHWFWICPALDRGQAGAIFFAQESSMGAGLLAWLL